MISDMFICKIKKKCDHQPAIHFAAGLISFLLFLEGVGTQDWLAALTQPLQVCIATAGSIMLPQEYDD
jgi:hypothetical protein